jgi:hypothetical protein
MHEINPERLGGRNEDGDDGEQDRAAFEQAAEDQENDIGDEQEAPVRQPPSGAMGRLRRRP